MVLFQSMKKNSRMGSRKNKETDLWEINLVNDQLFLLLSFLSFKIMAHKSCSLVFYQGEPHIFFASSTFSFLPLFFLFVLNSTGGSYFSFSTLGLHVFLVLYSSSTSILTLLLWHRPSKIINIFFCFQSCFK